VQQLSPLLTVLLQSHPTDLLAGQDGNQRDIVSQVVVDEPPQDNPQFGHRQGLKPLDTPRQDSLMGLVGREIQKSSDIFPVEVLMVQFFQIAHEGVEDLFSLGRYQQFGHSLMAAHFCTNIRNDVVDEIGLGIFF
jgi:hypothetical protein